MAVNKVIFGGNTLIDLSGDTVSDASHIVSGYVGHLRDGTQVTGTGSGSGGGGLEHWTRPADYPDLDSITMADDEVYITYSSRLEDCSFACFYFKTSGNVTVETGYIENGAFVADTVETKKGNITYFQDFRNSARDYVVLKLKGKITQFSTYNSSAFDNTGTYYTSFSQSMLEIYASLPYATSITFRGLLWVKHIYLANATLPTNLTNLCNNCEQLEWFETNGFVSASTNNSSLFSYCYKLLTADMKNFVSASCNNIASMFYNCIRLNAVDTEGWDTRNVTNFSNLFYYCGKLQTVDVSGWNTSSCVNSFAGTFTNCVSLKSVDVSNWDTSHCINMENMFNSCGELETIDVSKWDTSACTKMNNMFRSCAKLKTLDVSKWDTGKVTAMDSTFASCISLRRLDISGWDVGNVTTFAAMFNGVVNLLELDISALDMSGITAVGNMNNFMREQGMRSITIPASLRYIGAYSFRSEITQELHLLATTPPTLGNSNSFTLKAGKKIYVPYSADHSVLNAYKTASVWSGISSYIFEESE